MALALGMLPACSTVRPLTSPPKTRTIRLKAPVVERDILAVTTLPAGEYRVTSEDDEGFYYAAPNKIVTKGASTAGFDGGLYVPKDGNLPTHYYTLMGRSQSAKHRLTTPPAVEMN